ncbi:uncharacterized protein LOC131939660 [Physella acuta]|uniref:uncharacterized protein LOC131939660 n=1 Tax=Physella acuta TaxID=109671 RepID=UPI0027DC46D1|nr:uncharacterized protein LOC131939660 [Physella acuta]
MGTRMISAVLAFAMLIVVHSADELVLQLNGNLGRYPDTTVKRLIQRGVVSPVPRTNERGFRYFVQVTRDNVVFIPGLGFQSIRPQGTVKFVPIIQQQRMTRCNPCSVRQARPISAPAWVQPFADMPMATWPRDPLVLDRRVQSPLLNRLMPAPSFERLAPTAGMSTFGRDTFERRLPSANSEGSLIQGPKSLANSDGQVNGFPIDGRASGVFEKQASGRSLNTRNPDIISDGVVSGPPVGSRPPSLISDGLLPDNSGQGGGDMGKPDSGVTVKPSTTTHKLAATTSTERPSSAQEKINSSKQIPVSLSTETTTVAENRFTTTSGDLHQGSD